MCFNKKENYIKKLITVLLRKRKHRLLLMEITNNKKK